MHWWQIRKRGADLERELRYDLELEEEEQREKGLSAEEARYAARRAFGNPTLIREQTHEAWGTAQFERFWQDVHYALRQMRRSPGFTLVVVLTMALGIAATTTMFTVVYSTLLRSLPYPQSERIVAIHDTRIAGRSAGGLMTGPRFYDIEARNRSLSSLALLYFDESTLIAGKKLPIYVKAAGANAGFWDVFDTAPMLGRVFNARDDVPHAPRTVVLSYPGWQRLFGGDPNIIGEQVKLDQQTATIVGVMPRGFSAPGGVDLWHAAQFTPCGQPALVSGDNSAARGRSAAGAGCLGTARGFSVFCGECAPCVGRRRYGNPPGIRADSHRRYQPAGNSGAAGHDSHGRDCYWGRSADLGGNWNRVRSGSGAGDTEGAAAFGAQAGWDTPRRIIGQLVAQRPGGGAGRSVSRAAGGCVAAGGVAVELDEAATGI